MSLRRSETPRLGFPTLARKYEAAISREFFKTLRDAKEANASSQEEAEADVEVGSSIPEEDCEVEPDEPEPTPPPRNLEQHSTGHLSSDLSPEKRSKSTVEPSEAGGTDSD